MGALSIKTFCREYAVSPSYVYKLIAAGAITAKKVSEKKTLIPRASAEAWLAAGRDFKPGEMSYGPRYGRPARHLENPETATA